VALFNWVKPFLLRSKNGRGGELPAHYRQVSAYDAGMICLPRGWKPKADTRTNGGQKPGKKDEETGRNSKNRTETPKTPKTPEKRGKIVEK